MSGCFFSHSWLLLQVHAFSVCDNPDYFYDFSQGLLDGLHADVNSREIVEVHDVSVEIGFQVSLREL